MYNENVTFNVERHIGEEENKIYCLQNYVVHHLSITLFTIWNEMCV